MQEESTQDLSFLSHLITEEVYLIAEEEVAPPATQSKHPIAESSPEPPTAPAVAPESEAPKESPAAPTPLEATVQEQVAEEPAPVYLKPLPTAGKNLKQTLVFVNSSAEVLEPDSQAFLLKIMSAVKRGLDDILLVNVKEASAEQIEALLAEQPHRQLLCFGTENTREVAKAAHYEIEEVGKRQYLNAHDLTQIAADTEKKRALWTALQKIFL